MGADSHPGTTAGCDDRQPGFNFCRAFARHWRDSVRRHGVWGAISQLALALYRLLLEFVPGRRKIKFGDLDFDVDHEVDTTRSNVRFRTQLAAALTGHQYFASEPWIFEEIMQALPVNARDYTFIDLGSGKGRALLMAAAHGFSRVIGVEYLPELHNGAQRNIQRFSADRDCQTEIQSLCIDARDFQFPSGPLVVYLFNPFPEAAFATVIENLRRSFETHQRPIWIAYRFLEFEHLLANCNRLEKVAGTEQWALYRFSAQ